MKCTIWYEIHKLPLNKQQGSDFGLSVLHIRRQSWKEEKKKSSPNLNCRLEPLSIHTSACRIFLHCPCLRARMISLGQISNTLFCSRCSSHINTASLNELLEFTAAHAARALPDSALTPCFSAHRLICERAVYLASQFLPPFSLPIAPLPSDILSPFLLLDVRSPHYFHLTANVWFPLALLLLWMLAWETSMIWHIFWMNLSNLDSLPSGMYQYSVFCLFWDLEKTLKNLRVHVLCTKTSHWRAQNHLSNMWEAITFCGIEWSPVCNH